MTRKKHPRLRTPATTLLAGTGIALAFGISKSWSVAMYFIGMASYGVHDDVPGTAEAERSDSRAIS